MSAISRYAFLFAFAVMLTGCAGLPEVPYDHSTANVHTIGLPTPSFPDRPSVALASSVGQSFGLVGALVDAGMESNRESQFEGIIKNANFAPPEVFSQKLTEALTQHGYVVVPIASDRKYNEDLKEMPPASQPVDADLDIVVVNYGYVAAGIGSDTPYRPFMILRCRLIKTSDKSVLMQDMIDLNPVLFPKTDKEITLSPAPEFVFTDFDTLTSQPAKATEGLSKSFTQVTTSLGKLLQ